MHDYIMRFLPRSVLHTLDLRSTGPQPRPWCCLISCEDRQSERATAPTLWAWHRRRMRARASVA